MWYVSSSSEETETVIGPDVAPTLLMDADLLEAHPPLRIAAAPKLHFIIWILGKCRLGKKHTVHKCWEHV